LSEEQQYLSAHFAGRRLDGVRPGAALDQMDVAKS
jgi:hypothetical protein